MRRRRKINASTRTLWHTCVTALVRESSLIRAEDLTDVALDVSSPRQLHHERRPATNFTLDYDRTTTLLDDPERGRQTQPRAMTFVLGRKEWLEHPPPRLVVHADAGVTDLQHHATVLACGGADGDRAVHWNRVPCIHHQVHDDPLDLAGIETHARQIRCQL